MIAVIRTHCIPQHQLNVMAQKLYWDSHDAGHCLGDDDYAYNCYSIFLFPAPPQRCVYYI